MPVTRAALGACALLLWAGCAPAPEEEETLPRDGGARRDAGVPSNDAGVLDAGFAWPELSVDGGYARFSLEGWRISMAEPLVTTQRALGTQVAAHLQGDLRAVVTALPASIVARLRQVPVWVEVSVPAFPGGAYHPSAQWLTDNGYPAAWAKGVQLGNAANYLEWTRTQPAMVLHEFAHAWHDQVLGFDDADVLRAFSAAVDGGVYDDVAYAQGGTRRAYALTNHHEYFAEASEAWFWRNDFAPFVRGELQSVDPLGAALMQAKWQGP